MAVSTRYTVLGSSSNFLDFYIPYGDLSLDGQELLFKGNTGVDQVYVGSAQGLVFDFTQAGSSVDKIYLEGALSDYGFTYAGSVITLTRESGGSEVVKVLNTDSLIFSNGTVSGADALTYASGGATPVPTGEASTAFPIEAQGTFDTTVRAVVYDGDGETLALVRPGVALVVKGNSGVDVVYVNAGTEVDATQLLGGADQIYLMGNLDDYEGSVAGSVVTLTRTVDSNVELVKFLSGSDEVIFADGSANSLDLLNFYKDGTAVTLDTAVKTPLPGPTVTISADDTALASGEIAAVIFELSESPALGTSFTQNDLTVTGGVLSNFTGSGTTYTATFTPDALGVEPGVIVVKDNAFTGLDGKTSTSSSLEIDVDFAAPTLESISRTGQVQQATNADSLSFTATFSEDVVGLSVADFTLTTSSTATITAVSSLGDGAYEVVVSGGDIATFEGDVSLALANNVTATDVAGNDLGTSALSATYSVDHTAPTLDSLAKSTPDSTSTNADELVIRAEFSEAVSNFDASDLTVVSDSGAVVSSVTELSDGVYDITVSGGDLVTFEGTVDVAFSAEQDIADSAGNALALPNDTLNYVIDNTSPVAPAAPTVETVGQSIDATEFDSAITSVVSLAGTNAAVGDVVELLLDGESFATALAVTLDQNTVDAGQVSFVIPAGGLVGDGTRILTSIVTDQAGNQSAESAGLSLSVNTGTAPTLVSLQVSNPTADTTNADTLVFQAKFSEAVQNVNASDFTVSGGTSAAVTNAALVAGTTATYNVTVSGGNLASYNGDVTLGFSATQDIADTTGLGLVTPSATATYTLDNSAPAPETAPTAVAGAVINASEYTNGFVVVADLPDAGTAVGDTIELKVGGLSFATPLKHTLTQSDIDSGSVEFTVASGLGSDGAKSLTAVYADSLGNTGVSSTLSLTLDTTAPVALNAPTSSDGSSVNSAEYSDGVNVSVSLAGTSLKAGDSLELLIAGQSFNPALTHVLTQQEVTAASYTFALATGSLGSDGTKSLSVKATDAAGNVGAAGATLSLTLDTVGPELESLAISNPASATTKADELVFRATFTEQVANVGVNDFEIVDNAPTTASITSVTSVGNNAYDITVSGGDLANFNGAVTLGLVDSASIADVAGNAASSSALEASYTVDNTKPLAASVAPTSVNAGSVINAAEAAAGFDIEVSLVGTEAVAGDRVELKLGGQSLSTPLVHTLTSSDITNQSYTFSVTGASLGADGSKQFTSVVTDKAGNIGSPSGTLTLTLDTAAPDAPTNAPTAAAASDGVVSSQEYAAGFNVVTSLIGSGAVAGDSVELFLDGASFETPLTKTLTSTDISAKSVTFSISNGSLGDDGVKSITSIVTDAAGNSGAESAELSFTLDTNSLVRKLSYSAYEFYEALENNGTIHNSITITLTGGSFVGTNGDSINSTFYTMSNLPTGLSVNLVKVSDTKATLSFDGQATQANDANDIANLTIQFKDGAFSNGDASGVTGFTNNDLVINFADSGKILTANDILPGTTGDDILYGTEDVQVVSGFGADTIDITSAGTTAANSATVIVNDIANGVDTVFGFKGGTTATGGDVLNLSAISAIDSDSVVTAQTLATDFADHNVYVFTSTQVSIDEAIAAISADEDVTTSEGYVVIRDAENNGQVTVYHSDDLAGGAGVETALLILADISIGSLIAENFSV